MAPTTWVGRALRVMPAGAGSRELSRELNRRMMHRGRNMDFFAESVSVAATCVLAAEWLLATGLATGLPMGAAALSPEVS